MAVSSSSTTTRMTSLTGGRAAARVVAGSRRPARRPPSTMIRASHTTEEEDCDNTAAKPIVTIAGKAVSAVVAAAVSLSSATHAAQAQVVRAPTSSLSLFDFAFCADVRGVVGVGVFLFDAMDEKDIVVVLKRSRIGSR